MTRTRRTIRPSEWKISLPMDLAADVELALFDPTTKRPKYGGRSKLIEELLRTWLEDNRTAA